MRIAILSRAIDCYSTKRLKEEIVKRNHECLVLDYAKCSCLVEKANTRIFVGGQEIQNVCAILPRISAARTSYGAALIRQFESMKVFSTLSSIALVRSRDKLRSLQILAKHGINMPKTTFACHPKDAHNLIKQVGGVPVIIKVVEGSCGVGVMIAETEASAVSVIQSFQHIKTDIIVQQFITEAKGSDIRAFVINGNIIGAIKRTSKDGEFRSNLHQGGKAQAIELTDEESSIALCAAKSLGLNIAGVDILQSNDGPKVIEVNSSPGLEGIESATNINVAGEIIAYVEENVSSAIADTVGA